MDCTSIAPAGSILHCALEQSKNTRLLGIQFPDRKQPSLYPIRGGNTEDLLAKLTAARDRCGKLSGRAPCSQDRGDGIRLLHQHSCPRLQLQA
jgi:hypothetical protein